MGAVVDNTKVVFSSGRTHDNFSDVDRFVVEKGTAVRPTQVGRGEIESAHFLEHLECIILGDGCWSLAAEWARSRVAGPHSYIGCDGCNPTALLFRMRESFPQVRSELGNRLTEPAAMHVMYMESEQPLLEERCCLVSLVVGASGKGKVLSHQLKGGRTQGRKLTTANGTLSG